MNYEDASEIELAVAEYFGVRRNIIVPNVGWGLYLHECDLLILSKSRYAYEIEIKTSKLDLKRDSKKRHGHLSRKIKGLYFAIPEKLRSHMGLIPERAGIIVVNRNGQVEKLREAEFNCNVGKFEQHEALKLAHLGSMRIWALKRVILYHTPWQEKPI